MRFPRRSFIASGAVLSIAARRAMAARALAAGAEPHSAPPPSPHMGALFPLSGGDALIGDEALRGVQLALDAVNQAGGIAGRPLGLAVADAVGQSEAESIARNLIAANHLDLLLGTGTSSIAYSGSDAAELAQIPYIEINAAADGITGRNFKFLIRICLDTTMIAARATAAIAQRFPNAPIGLLFNTGATEGAIAAAALAQWQAAKITPLLSIGYAPDAANLHEEVGRLKRAGAGVVLHAAGQDDVLVFFEALQDAGWRPAAVIGCGDGYGLRETAFALGPALDGVYVTAAPFYPAAAGAVAQAYQARFAMAPRSAESLSAYVGARLVFDTLARLRGDARQLLAALRQSSLPVGALANGWGVAFDKTGQNTRAFATLQQWRAGTLIPLDQG